MLQPWPNDPELPHAELQRRSLDPESRCRAVGPGNDPVRLLERGDDVAPVGGRQGVIVRLGAAARLRARGDGRQAAVSQSLHWYFEGGTGRQNDRTFDQILQFANV